MERKDEEERGIDEMGMIVELGVLGEFGLDRAMPSAPAIERDQIFSPREISPNLPLCSPGESDYRRPATNKKPTAKAFYLC